MIVFWILALVLASFTFFVGLTLYNWGIILSLLAVTAAESRKSGSPSLPV